jgi:hypothetical protein
MNIRFDTNTKSAEAASNAFQEIASKFEPEDLMLSLSTWGETHFNITGTVDSTHVAKLNQVFVDTKLFNEDVDKL